MWIKLVTLVLASIINAKESHGMPTLQWIQSWITQRRQNFNILPRNSYTRTHNDRVPACVVCQINNHCDGHPTLRHPSPPLFSRTPTNNASCITGIASLSILERTHAPSTRSLLSWHVIIYIIISNYFLIFLPNLAEQCGKQVQIGDSICHSTGFNHLVE